MNLYHSTTKGLRECRAARHQQLQQLHSHDHPHDEHKKHTRKSSVFARLFRRH